MFAYIRWLLGITAPEPLKPELGVLVKCWPDEKYITYLDAPSPPTDEELVMDAICSTAIYIATRGPSHDR